MLCTARARAHPPPPPRLPHVLCPISHRIAHYISSAVEGAGVAAAWLRLMTASAAARMPTPSEYFAGQGSLSVGSLDAEESKGGDHELELSADEQAAKEAFASQRRFVHLHELRAQAEALEEAHLGEQSCV